MIADAHFAIGKTHAVCQDYCRVGVLRSAREHRYAIVSDGCSSSPDTDFGARLLTMSAIQQLEHCQTFDEDAVIWRVGGRVPDGLSARCLDATLLVAHWRPDCGVEVMAWGDGVLLLRRRDGAVETWQLDYAGAPGYLSYYLDPERFRLFALKGQRCVTHAIDGVVQSITTAAIAAPEQMRWALDPLDPDVYELVMWLSDGALSFQHVGTTEVVPLMKVVPHLVDIRVPAGAFLQRSHKFFLQKTCPRLGWQHYDDFAAAALFAEAAG